MNNTPISETATIKTKEISLECERTGAYLNATLDEDGVWRLMDYHSIDVVSVSDLHRLTGQLNTMINQTE